MPSQTYLNFDWLHTPLTPEDSSARAIINIQILLGIAQLGLLPIVSIILYNKFTIQW